MNKTAERIYTGTKVDLETYQRMNELADRNERSVAAEIRLALAEHLQREQVAGPRESEKG